MTERSASIGQQTLFGEPVAKPTQPAAPAKKFIVRDEKGQAVARHTIQHERDYYHAAYMALADGYSRSNVYYHPHGNVTTKLMDRLIAVVHANDDLLSQEGEDLPTGPGRPLCSYERKSRADTPGSDYECGHRHCMTCGGHGVYTDKGGTWKPNCKCGEGGPASAEVEAGEPEDEDE